MSKLKTGMTIKCNVSLRDANTGEILAKARNMVVTTGQALTGNLLINSAGYSTGLSYCAIGTSTTAVSEGQTQLVAETKRQQIAQKSITGNVISVSTFFVAADCGIFIKEVGLFGNDATATANSGTMFARALLSYDNSGSPRNLVIAWSITIAHA